MIAAYQGAFKNPINIKRLTGSPAFYRKCYRLLIFIIRALTPNLCIFCAFFVDGRRSIAHVYDSNTTIILQLHNRASDILIAQWRRMMSSTIRGGVRCPIMYFVVAIAAVVLALPLAVASGQMQVGGVFDECLEKCSGATQVANLPE